MIVGRRRGAAPIDGPVVGRRMLESLQTGPAPGEWPGCVSRNHSGPNTVTPFTKIRLSGQARGRRGRQSRRVMLVMELLQRRREKHVSHSDSHRISARYQRRHQTQPAQTEKKEFFRPFFFLLNNSEICPRRLIKVRKCMDDWIKFFGNSWLSKWAGIRYNVWHVDGIKAIEVSNNRSAN